VRTWWTLALLVGSLAIGSSACTSVVGDLETAQTMYRDARYEQTAAWLEALEPELSSMSSDERGRFYYLRGMSAFRLGQRAEALHNLVLASVIFTEAPSRVPRGWRAVLERTLEALSPGGSAQVLGASS
jgi:hypothetical protein